MRFLAVVVIALFACSSTSDEPEVTEPDSAACEAADQVLDVAEEAWAASGEQGDPTAEQLVTSGFLDPSTAELLDECG